MLYFETGPYCASSSPPTTSLLTTSSSSSADTTFIISAGPEIYFVARFIIRDTAAACFFSCHRPYHDLLTDAVTANVLASTAGTFAVIPARLRRRYPDRTIIMHALAAVPSPLTIITVIGTAADASTADTPPPPPKVIAATAVAATAAVAATTATTAAASGNGYLAISSGLSIQIYYVDGGGGTPPVLTATINDSAVAAAAAAAAAAADVRYELSQFAMSYDSGNIAAMLVTTPTSASSGRRRRRRCKQIRVYSGDTTTGGAVVVSCINKSIVTSPPSSFVQADLSNDGDILTTVSVYDDDGDDGTIRRYNVECWSYGVVSAGGVWIKIYSRDVHSTSTSLPFLAMPPPPSLPPSSSIAVAAAGGRRVAFITNISTSGVAGTALIIHFTVATYVSDDDAWDENDYIATFTLKGSISLPNIIRAIRLSDDDDGGGDSVSDRPHVTFDLVYNGVAAVAAADYDDGTGVRYDRRYIRDEKQSRTTTACEAIFIDDGGGDGAPPRLPPLSSIKNAFPHSIRPLLLLVG